MYYVYRVDVASAFDTNSLMVVGNIKCFLDENRLYYLTDVMWEKFLFDEIPDKTIEGFESYVEKKVRAMISTPEQIKKFVDLKAAMDLGIWKPVNDYMNLPEEEKARYKYVIVGELPTD